MIDLGERVVAFIVGSAEIDAAECKRWFSEHGVARFKTPEVVVRIEEIPLLAAGKPDRTALKARAAATGEVNPMPMTARLKPGRMVPVDLPPTPEEEAFRDEVRHLATK